MKWIGLCLSVVVASVAYGQGSMRAAKPVPPSPEVSALLKKMRTAYSTTKSAKLKMGFTQTAEEGSVTVMSDGTFSAPSSFKNKSNGLPGFEGKAYVLTTDGKRIQVEGTGSAKAEPYGIQTMVTDLPHTNLEVLCFWDWPRQLSTSTGGNMRMSTFRLGKTNWRGKSYTLLEETAKAQGIQVRYLVDPKTSFIWRTEQYRINEKKPFTVSWIDKMDLNVPVDKKIYKITAKPRVKKKESGDVISA